MIYGGAEMHHYVIRFSFALSIFFIGIGTSHAQPDALPLALVLNVPGAHLKVSLRPNLCTYPDQIFAQVEKVNEGSHVLLAVGNCDDLAELRSNGMSVPRHSLQINVLNRDFDVATRVSKGLFLAECRQALISSEGQKWLEDAAREISGAQYRLSLQEIRHQGILVATNEAVFAGALEYLSRGDVKIVNAQITACFVAGSVPLEWLFQAPVDPNADPSAIRETIAAILEEAQSRVDATIRMNR